MTLSDDVILFKGKTEDYGKELVLKVTFTQIITPATTPPDWADPGTPTPTPIQVVPPVPTSSPSPTICSDTSAEKFWAENKVARISFILMDCCCW